MLYKTRYYYCRNQHNEYDRYFILIFILPFGIVMGIDYTICYKPKYRDENYIKIYTIFYIPDKNSTKYLCKNEKSFTYSIFD